MTVARTEQVQGEVLVQPDGVNARTGQILGEVLLQPDGVNARTTQIWGEVLYLENTGPVGPATVREGGAWVAAQVKVREGGAWVNAISKVREGGAWVTATLGVEASTAVSFVAAGTAIWETGFESPAGTTDVPMPAGLSTDDVAVIVCRNGISSNSITTPAGWTQLYDAQQAGTRMAVFWRLIDGTEAATVTVTFTGANNLRGGQTFGFTGVDAAGPVANTTANFVGVSGAGDRNTYTGTLPTVAAGDLILYVTAAEADPTPTVPAGTTLRSATTGSLFMYAAEIADLESAPAITTWGSYTGGIGQDSNTGPVLIKAG